MIQKFSNDKYRGVCKKPIKHHSCEDYVWNPSICAYKFDKDCDRGQNLKDCTCMKRLDDLVCTEIEDTPENASVNSSNGINY